jgi:D-alanine-D-alanine ligase
MKRTTVLLLYGGESSEHDVSVSSARNVYAAIDDSKYDVLLCYIDNGGKWWLVDEIGDAVDADSTLQIAPSLGEGVFVTLPDNNVIKPDVILPILHGKNGEDGSVQGLAQLLHIPIVGCDMTSSAICMDKIATKEIAKSHNIAVVPYEVHRRGTPVPDFNNLSLKLSSPMFVKPSRAGSSVGVSKVHGEGELARAISLAHIQDDVVLIERGISGRELEVSVLGNPPNHKTSGVGEILPGDEFYSYDAKYAEESTSKVVVPADLTEVEASRIRSIASKAYEALGCAGLARVDFFLAGDGTIYMNEINTLPGFTNISMYPKLWRQEGISYSELIDRLITLALESSKNSN